MDANEGAQLLSILYAQATYPQNQVRLRWQPNTIAFWNKRSEQHDAASHYFPQVPRVERITMTDDALYYDPDQAPAELPRCFSWARSNCNEREFYSRSDLPARPLSSVESAAG
jgi:hypothetical protein